MSGKKLLTIFGATGNQGGSILDTVLSHPALKEKYSLRGITRDPSSPKSQHLTSLGVEMTRADVDDHASCKAAIVGSHGVFGVTDFWSILDKEREIQQGKNIFHACKENGVKHFVWSALPWAEKITEGQLRHVDHFDSKAVVAEYVEREKGEMVVSHCMPAMFIDSIARSVRRAPDSEKAVLSMPFPSDSIDWPVIAPRRDYGKWVMGLFEAGSAANGVYVHAISTWTTPKEVVTALSKHANVDVVFESAGNEDYTARMQKVRGEEAGVELSQTMQLIGGWNYYGKGAKEKQAESDKWLLDGADLISSYEQWAEENGPFEYE